MRSQFQGKMIAMSKLNERQRRHEVLKLYLKFTPPYQIAEILEEIQETIYEDIRELTSSKPTYESRKYYLVEAGQYE